MSEVRTDTAHERPQPADAVGADAGGAGKHRGGAATSEDGAAPAHGRHRRPGPSEGGGA